MCSSKEQNLLKESVMGRDIKSVDERGYVQVGVRSVDEIVVEDKVVGFIITIARFNMVYKDLNNFKDIDIGVMTESPVDIKCLTIDTLRHIVHKLISSCINVISKKMFHCDEEVTMEYFGIKLSNNKVLVNDNIVAILNVEECNKNATRLSDYLEDLLNKVFGKIGYNRYYTFREE